MLVCWVECKGRSVDEVPDLLKMLLISFEYITSPGEDGVSFTDR